MNTDLERNRVLDQLSRLQQARASDLLAFAAHNDCISLGTALQCNYAAASALLQYARCRGWAIHYRAQGATRLAKRESALAGCQVRTLHAFFPERRSA